MFKTPQNLKLHVYLYAFTFAVLLMLTGCSAEREAKQFASAFKLIENPEALVGDGFEFDDVAGELEIVSDLRRGFYMGSAHSLTFEVPGPGMGVVKFAYGFGPMAHQHSGIVEISINVESDGQNYKIGVWKTDPRSRDSLDRWHEAAARWPDGVVGDARLTFTVDGMLDHDLRETFFLAHPAVIPERGPSEFKRVILINVTALRADHLGCYGYGRPTSANIDAFAKDGALFEDCRATSPWTFPSAASVLTGLIPSKAGATTEEGFIEDGLDYLPEMLSQKGYATLSIHSSRWVGRKTGMHRGFDRSHVFIYTHVAEILKAAEDWLSMHADEDMFAFINLAETGLPYRAPLSCRGTFDPEYEGEFKYFYVEHTYYWGGEIGYPDDVKEHLKALYDEEVFALDLALGEFITFLKSSGFYDNSLIIITGLHGEELFEHGGLGHGHQLYNEVMKVPLIIRGERFGEGRIEGLCSPMDIFPTVLSWLGYDIPDGIDGVSLLGSGDGATGRVIQAEQILNGEEMKSLTTSEYHYIYNTDDNSEELYSLIDDPAMLNNIAGENHDVVLKFRGMLEDWMGVSVD